MTGKTQREYKPSDLEQSQLDRLFEQATRRMTVTVEEGLLIPTNLIDGVSQIYQDCAYLLSACEQGNYQIRRIFVLTSSCLLYYTEIVQPGSDPRFLFNAAVDEVKNARLKFPWWPCDDRYAAVIVAEEGGELLKAANEVFWSHKDATMDEVYAELVQTVAMCIRFYIESVCINE